MDLNVEQKIIDKKTHGNKKHGMAKSPTNNIWSGLFTRCYNTKALTYKYYGARGIKVCDRWRKFENFLEDMGPRPDGMQLDRINNDGDYEPSNCRWVSRQQNMLNKPSHAKKIEGKKFGKLTVLQRVDGPKRAHAYYLTKCDCGNEKIRCGSELRRGRSTQCLDCKNKEHSLKHKEWHKKQREMNGS